MGNTNLTKGEIVAENFLETNAGNQMLGRHGNIITVGVFHRTGNAGVDLAINEAKFSHTHNSQASFYEVIDASGIMWRVTNPVNTEYAVADPVINMKSLNYELTGVNGSALTTQQITTLITVIRNDSATKHIPNHRLTLPEILAIHNGKPINGVIGGWCTHKDITLAIKGVGMSHTDYISELEITTILKGIAA
jgi:hypothetical protein